MSQRTQKFKGENKNFNENSKISKETIKFYNEH